MPGILYRTRFKNEIVAEFLLPARKLKKQRIIILCDGMPSVPRKQPLMSFLSRKGFWVFYPRYRGAWESGGEFLDISPHQDISEIIDEMPKGIKESAFGNKFTLSPDEIIIIGGSFGGTTAILSSLDKRVSKIIANCPIVNWNILPEEQKKETAARSYPAYISNAFGNGYRLQTKNWNKLKSGKFFNPSNYVSEFEASKILIFHAKDDPYIPWKDISRFAKRTGAKLILLNKGGHIRTEFIVEKYWAKIKKFIDAKIPSE
jgi:esterase/lipase